MDEFADKSTEIMEDIAEVVSPISSKVANFFEQSGFVKNDSLYAPLTHEDGQVCGVGANLIMIHDPPLDVKSDHYHYIDIIESVEPDTPAAKAGMQQGDIIVEVDGQNLDYGRQVYLPEDVAELIRGPHGSTVSIVVQRMGVDMKFILTREVLEVMPSGLVHGVKKAVVNSPLSSPSKKSGGAVVNAVTP